MQNCNKFNYFTSEIHDSWKNAILFYTHND